MDRSLKGDGLAYSDSAYVLTLLRGTRMVMASMVLVIVTIVVLMIAVRSCRGWTTTSFIASLVVSFGLFLGGWWLLTTPDLGQLTTNKGEQPRRFARALA